MDAFAGTFDPFAAIRRAQREQLNALMALRAQRGRQMQQQVPQRRGQGGNVVTLARDTVTLGDHAPDLGLMPAPWQMGAQHEIPRMDDPNYWAKQNAYFDDTISQIMAIKAMEAALGMQNDAGTKNAKKGDLNVVAGNRTDGVKAKKVTVHERGRWSTRQWDENIGGYRSHESKFENGQVGKTYQVTVEWEDGSTTIRDVNMEHPGQTVYIDTAY